MIRYNHFYTLRNTFIIYMAYSLTKKSGKWNENFYMARGEVTAKILLLHVFMHIYIFRSYIRMLIFIKIYFRVFSILQCIFLNIILFSCIGRL